MEDIEVKEGDVGIKAGGVDVEVVDTTFLRSLEHHNATITFKTSLLTTKPDFRPGCRGFFALKSVY
jgi:hypothetical protein